ncbi:ferric reductase-like transmembrane domain-containing protein [Candidatus Woesebacteria bacterium]|nr:ferric reductase-like transmembrane domain-containing protein [Candidatus Woesebacteria bacterium]
MFTSIVPLASANRSTIIRIFQLCYVLALVFLGGSAYLLLTGHPLSLVINEMGEKFGQLALCFFILASIPGMAGRFRIKHPLVTIGLMFRRHIGISTFVLAFMHSQISYIIPFISLGMLPPFPPPIFVLWGASAYLGLFILFITSNDWSVKKLGDWWKRLHKLLYILFWFIFLHVAFQELSVWAILILLFAIFEVASLVYDFMRKRQTVAVKPVVQSTPL